MCSEIMAKTLLKSRILLNEIDAAGKGFKTLAVIQQEMLKSVL